MDKFLILFKATDLIELLLDKVFNGFDVVISYLLDILYTLCIILRELTVNNTQSFETVCVDRSQLG